MADINIQVLGDNGSDIVYPKASAENFTGTLGIDHGGTGRATDSTLLVNLEANGTAANVFPASGDQSQPGVTGELNIVNGGTGRSATSRVLVNLASNDPSKVFPDSQSATSPETDVVNPGVTGTLGLGNGGTGVTQATDILVDLASTSAANVFPASGTRSTPGIKNTLPVGHGGTGKTTLAEAREAMGLGNSTSTLDIAYGGTGRSVASQIKVNLGSNSAVNVFPSSQSAATDCVTPGVSGTLPVGYGGTGATSFTSGAALIGNNSSAIQTRSINNNATIGTSPSKDSALITNNTMLAMMNRSTSIANDSKNYAGTADTFAAPSSTATLFMVRGEGFASSEPDTSFLSTMKNGQIL